MIEIIHAHLHPLIHHSFSTPNCHPQVFFLPAFLFGAVLTSALVGVLGENFIMVLVKQFGAVVTVTTTTVRKGLSLVLSFVLFPKVFRWGYLVGGMVMVAGIVLNVLVKNPKARQAWATKCCAGGREGKQQSVLPLVV